jgi:signal transduction histidine kinase
MATINAYGVLFREWESLVNACQENATALGDVESLRTPLVSILARLKELKSRQENLEGARQQTTQEIRELVEEGREVVRRLRVYAKARLGTRSERLTQFGVAPLRKRGSRKAALTKSAPTEAPVVPSE